MTTVARGTLGCVAQAWITGDRLLSPEMVCEMVPGMTLAILEDRRKRKIDPRFHKPSLRTVVYRESDVLAWVLGSVVETRPAP